MTERGLHHACFVFLAFALLLIAVNLTTTASARSDRDYFVHSPLGHKGADVTCVDVKKRYEGDFNACVDDNGDDEDAKIFCGCISDRFSNETLPKSAPIPFCEHDGGAKHCTYEGKLRCVDGSRSRRRGFCELSLARCSVNFVVPHTEASRYKSKRLLDALNQYFANCNQTPGPDPIRIRGRR